MLELYKKEDAQYKKELAVKDRPDYNNPSINEETKDYNSNSPNRVRFDKRRIYSAKDDNYQHFERELMSNLNLNYMNIGQQLPEITEFNELLDKDREERMRMDDEIRKRHKQLALLKQEEILKKKKFQDDLLGQINEKIQRQRQYINSKYLEPSIDYISAFK